MLAYKTGTEGLPISARQTKVWRKPCHTDKGTPLLFFLLLVQFPTLTLTKLILGSYATLLFPGVVAYLKSQYSVRTKESKSMSKINSSLTVPLHLTSLAAWRGVECPLLPKPPTWTICTDRRGLIGRVTALAEQLSWKFRPPCLGVTLMFL